MPALRKPKDPRRTGRPRATAPSGTLDVHAIHRMRAADPPASWHRIGVLMGVSDEAVRRFYLRWRGLVDA